jgi:hypothetical protein
MKVTEAPNYSWVTHVEDDARTYDITGQTDKTDYSLVTMPMISAIRRRVSRSTSNSDNLVEAVFKGSEKCVVQTENGWKTPAELAEQQRAERAGGSRGGGYPGGGYPGGGFPGGRGRRSGPAPAIPYSNLQVSLSRPAEEIGVIVGSYTAIKAEGENLTGTLSETGAKLLLVHAGQDQLTPLTASGTFRLVIRDGVLVRYELKLDGTLSVQTPNATREIEVHQKSDTDIRNLGSTKFEVPEDARKKLAG